MSNSTSITAPITVVSVNSGIALFLCILVSSSVVVKNFSHQAYTAVAFGLSSGSLLSYGTYLSYTNARGFFKLHKFSPGDQSMMTTVFFCLGAVLLYVVEHFIKKSHGDVDLGDEDDDAILIKTPAEATENEKSNPYADFNPLKAQSETDSVRSSTSSSIEDEPIALNSISRTKVAYVIFIGICVSNFLDGILLNYTLSKNTKLVKSVLVIQCLLSLAKGSIVGMSALDAFDSKKKAILFTLLSSLGGHVGVFFGDATNVSSLAFLGIASALVSGMLTILALRFVLPTARWLDQNDFYVSNMVLLSVTIMPFVFFLSKFIN